METELKFTKNKEVWEAKFVSAGNTVIQIERSEPSIVIILANLEGMEPVIVGKYDNNHSTFAIFNINVPSGIEITVRTRTEVLRAKIHTE